MTDREKVIKGLECCVPMMEKAGVGDCDNCPYHNLMKMNDLIGCHRDLLNDVLALLKGPEPRVLGKPEIPNHDGFMYVEDQNWILLEAICKEVNEGGFIFDTWLPGRRKSHNCAGCHIFERKEYGKTWRCWTSRPTEAEREAKPWN